MQKLWFFFFFQCTKQWLLYQCKNLDVYFAVHKTWFFSKIEAKNIEFFNINVKKLFFFVQHQRKTLTLFCAIQLSRDWIRNKYWDDNNKKWSRFHISGHKTTWRCFEFTIFFRFLAIDKGRPNPRANGKGCILMPMLRIRIQINLKKNNDTMCIRRMLHTPTGVPPTQQSKTKGHFSSQK